MPSSKRTRTSQTCRVSAWPATALPAMPPATLPAAVAIVCPAPPPMLLPSQPPRTAPPIAPTTWVVWFASVLSAIDWTTPVPDTPAPGVLAQPISVTAARTSTQRKNAVIVRSLRRRVEIEHRGQQRPGLAERREPAIEDLPDRAGAVDLHQPAVDGEAERRVAAHHQGVRLEREVVLQERVLDVAAGQDDTADEDHAVSGVAIDALLVQR